MVVVIPFVRLATVLGLALAGALRLLRVLRGPRTDQVADDPDVTLSVLPGKRVVVTVDTEPPWSPGAALLVDQAVRDAFTLTASKVSTCADPTENSFHGGCDRRPEGEG